MFEDLFSRGQLELSRDALLSGLTQSSVWWDVATNKILTGVAVAILLLNLTNLLSLVTPMIECFFRFKAAEGIEHSIGISRTRNISVASLVLPFSLILSRYDVYHPAYFDNLAPEFRTVITIAAVTLFILLVLLASLAVSHRGLSNDLFHAACHTPLNYFIIAFSLLVISMAVFMLFGISDIIAGRIIYVIIIFLWAFSLLRSFQILHSRCDFFTTILYLCALEILPSAVIIASEMLF